MGMPRVHIKESLYKNIPSVTIGNDRVSFQFLPQSGGKLASAVDLRTGREFMLQREGEAYRVQPYGGVYVLGECGGFDDMFPTIDECRYERFPWQGTLLPDHGEVWGLPWSSRVSGNVFEMEVSGIRLPYRLAKRVFFLEDTTLRIEYRLTNPTPFPMDYLWAAHVMIPAEEGAHIQVSDEYGTAVTVFSKSGRIGGYGTEFGWRAMRERGERIDRVRREDTCDFEKYYFKEKARGVGWCSIRYPSDRSELRLSYPAEFVPYLGILVNEGGWNHLYHIIFEPCSATMDRLETAALHGTLSVAAPGSERVWYLDLTIT